MQFSKLILFLLWLFGRNSGLEHQECSWEQMDLKECSFPLQGVALLPSQISLFYRTTLLNYTFPKVLQIPGI